MHLYYESRKRARKNWRQSEKGKAWDKAYSRRPDVKAKAHEYYVKNKNRPWGGKREKTLIYEHHEQWARDNGYRDNDTLNGKNSDRFVNYEVE